MCEGRTGCCSCSSGPREIPRPAGESAGLRDDSVRYTSAMINGAHFLLYTTDPEADRKFFHDVLNFRSVDLGHGWLIFALPPTEIAVHPSDDVVEQSPDHKKAWSLYLMCDDLQAEIKSLKAKKVRCTEIQEERWGITTTIPLPSGAEIGLYQPKHQTAHGVCSK